MFYLLNVAYIFFLFFFLFVVYFLSSRLHLYLKCCLSWCVSASFLFTCSNLLLFFFILVYSASHFLFSDIHFLPFLQYVPTALFFLFHIFLNPCLTNSLSHVFFYSSCLVHTFFRPGIKLQIKDYLCTSFYFLSFFFFQ